MNQRLARMDMGLFAAILLMLGFGIVLVYSSSFAIAHFKYGGADFFLSRQMIRALVAVICFMTFINIDYHVWGKLSSLAYLMALLLLVAVLFLPETQAINGAKRWITFGSIRFQVSDFARLALVLLLARKCSELEDDIKNWKVLSRLLVIIGIVCFLIVMEPDFSTAVVVGIIGLSMLFMSGAKFVHLAGIGVSLLPVMALLVLRTPYRRMRLLGFLHMSSRKKDLGYQVYQSLIGLGNGGIFGVGLGKGEQKFFYLPEPHTDFAFSILGEEIGFVGLMVVLSLFGFIIYRGMRAALYAPDKMGQLMAFGFTIVLVLYILLHAGVSTGLIPTTGVPLPFLSYGGMSLIFTMSSMGILLNISSQVNDRNAMEMKLPKGAG